MQHTIEVVIDRVKVAEGTSTRLADSLEIACNLSEGSALVDFEGRETLFSSKLACNNQKCERFSLGLPELEPRSFSFNSPYGACGTCDGLGFKRQFAEELIIPNPGLSINNGAIQASESQHALRCGPCRGRHDGHSRRMLHLLYEFTRTRNQDESLTKPFGERPSGA